jgi:predicted nucleic acid-binding Zn ribbon protein
MTLYRLSPRRVEAALTPLRSGWEPETLLAEVQRVWPATVGEVIAREAAPVAENAGVLTLSCSASVWANELDLMAPMILERLNEAMCRGAVRRLRCITSS